MKDFIQGVAFALIMYGGAFALLAAFAGNH